MARAGVGRYAGREDVSGVVDAVHELVVTTVASEPVAHLGEVIVDAFFDRFGGPVPRRWLARVKHELVSLGPQVVASRMVRDYTHQLYEPTAARADALAADGFARARDLAAYKARVAAAWGGVHVDGLDTDDGVADLGTTRAVHATVSLGELSPEDVDVQLLHGPVGPNGELGPEVTVAPLAVEDASARPARYSGELPLETPGRYGITVRVVPRHPDLVTPLELGKATWAP